MLDRLAAERPAFAAQHPPSLLPANLPGTQRSVNMLRGEAAPWSAGPITPSAASRSTETFGSETVTHHTPLSSVVPSLNGWFAYEGPGDPPQTPGGAVPNNNNTGPSDRDNARYTRNPWLTGGGGESLPSPLGTPPGIFPSAFPSLPSPRSMGTIDADRTSVVAAVRARVRNDSSDQPPSRSATAISNLSYETIPSYRSKAPSYRSERPSYHSRRRSSAASNGRWSVYPMPDMPAMPNDEERALTTL